MLPLTMKLVKLKHTERLYFLLFSWQRHSPLAGELDRERPADSEFDTAAGRSRLNLQD